MSYKTIELAILRYRPEIDQAPWFQDYRIPCEEDWVVLDAINYIKDHLDSTLSYRWSCHMAVCGSCGMMIDGEPRLSCKTFLRDLPEGKIRIEPLANFPIERDLVVVLDDFMEKLQRVKPYIIRKEERDARSGGASADAGSARTIHAIYPLHQLLLLLCRLSSIRPDPRVPRAGRPCLGAQIQSGLPRSGPGRSRRRCGQQYRDLGLRLCRRLLLGMSEAGGPGRGHPADEDREYGQLVSGPLGFGEEKDMMDKSLPKPFVREVVRTTWYLSSAARLGCIWPRSSAPSSSAATHCCCCGGSRRSPLAPKPIRLF
jgi:hypothetical protein